MQIMKIKETNSEVLSKDRGVKICRNQQKRASLGKPSIYGWEKRIRTSIHGVRVRCPTIERSPSVQARIYFIPPSNLIINRIFFFEAAEKS
jgi:hypothetical protein